MLILEIAILSLHLMCLNVASGAPLVGVWLEWKSRRGDALAVSLARYLLAAAPVALVAGTVLGLALGWLLWTPEYARLWQGPLSYKLKWGVLEMVFSLVLLGVIWFWRSRANGGSGWLARSLLALLSSTNLLYHFPVLFVIAARLTEAGQTTGPVLSGASFRAQMSAGETPAVAVHFALASLAMSGLLLMGYALRLARRGATPAEVDRVAVWGGFWALVPSLCQLPVGLWVLFTLPAEMQNRLLGSALSPTILFLAAMAGALWLLRELANVALGETARTQLIRAMTAMLVVIVLMTAMHRLARHRDRAPASTNSAAVVNER